MKSLRLEPAAAAQFLEYMYTIMNLDLVIDNASK
jgi:hypothetical protein